MAIVKSVSEINGQEIDIYIEVDKEPTTSSSELTFRGEETPSKKTTKAVGDLIGQGLALSRQCAAQVMDSVSQMSDSIKPNEFEVQLAIKFDSEMGAFIAKASAGAQMQVTMKWKLQKTPKQS
jgi:hypothetical protein